MISGLALSLQLSIGLLFLYATVSKVLESRRFIDGLAEYNLLPDGLVFVTGVTIVLSEAIIAFSHLSGWRLSAIAPLALGLMFVFGCVTTYLVAKGVSVRCLCFGADSGPVSVITIMRIALLMGAEVVVWLSLEFGVSLSLGSLSSAGAVLATVNAILILVLANWAVSARRLVTYWLGRRT